MHPLLRYAPDTEIDRRQPRPVLLDGPLVQLQPLSLTHVDELSLVARDDKFFHLMFDGPVYFQWGLKTLVQNLIEAQKYGTDLPFAVIHRASKLAVGITRYLNIQPRNRRLEIATWFASDFHGTGVNTESKYLLLRHAFETLRFVRVDFRIDKRNGESVKAVERLGAIFEAEIRKDCILADGTERTSRQYRICDDEWRDGIKSHILDLMEKHSAAEEERVTVSKRIAQLKALQATLVQQEEAIVRISRRVGDEITSTPQGPARSDTSF